MRCTVFFCAFGSGAYAFALASPSAAVYNVANGGVRMKRFFLCLTALVMLIQAKELWNKSRTAAIINLCTAIFVAAVCILILFIL